MFSNILQDFCNETSAAQAMSVYKYIKSKFCQGKHRAEPKESG